MDAGPDASIGTVGDALDNALMESAVGLYKTELIKPRRPWHALADVELATAEWVDWYNHRRPHTAIGNIPPAEHEAAYYATRQPSKAIAANHRSLHQPRHGSDELVNIPRDTSDLGQQMLRMVYNATRRHDVSIDPLTPWGQSQYHSIRLVQERDAGFTPSYDEEYIQLEPPDKRYVELHAECCPSLAE